MEKSHHFFTILFLLLTINSFAQQKECSLSINLSVDQSLAEGFLENGRLLVFMSLDSRREPRRQTWPNPRSKTYIFATNLDDFSLRKPLQLNGDNKWIGTPDWSLHNVPADEYYVQILWDQDTKESRVNAPGNIYSEKQKVDLSGSTDLTFVLDQKIPERKEVEHPLVRFVDFKSDALSKFWNKEVRLKASVLLPHNYDKNKAYPIRYNVAGYGGRYYRVNYLANDPRFMKWWESANAPEIITVFLDGEGPFGDSYQMDSDNSGPYGHALIHELVPHIESMYRGTQSPKHRFVDGCSTGGWVSLGLQLYYPDMFDGTFSYSPDAIAFENYQLINIYKDENAYVNEYGFERPLMRSVMGEPMLSMRDFMQHENVLGASNTYLNSGMQIGSHTALYSPKSENGLPKPLIHPQTGMIDHEVAEHWKKYDFKVYAKENWAELGPKLQGKIYIWMGDMDNFYLNTGTREFERFIKTTENPKSDAVIEFSAMKGHCDKFSHRKVLMQIYEVIKTDEKK